MTIQQRHRPHHQEDNIGFPDICTKMSQRESNEKLQEKKKKETKTKAKSNSYV